MSTYIGYEVAKQISTVDGLVTQKFTQSANMATAAANSAIAAIGQLGSVSPNIPPVNITFPSVSLDTSVAVARPGVPGIGMSSTTAPSAPSLRPIAGDEYFVTLITQLFLKNTEGATGLSPEVEQAIWDRALSREALEVQSKYTEAETYFSSRGFDLPPGALSGRLQEINIEILRNHGYLNNDIMTEQARLAQTNTYKILELLITAVGGYRKSLITEAAEYNKNVVSLYIGEVESFKAYVTGQVGQMDAMAKYIAALYDGYKADVQLAGVEVEAKIRGAEAQIKLATAQAEVLLKQSEISIETARIVYGIQVEAIKAAATVSAQLAAAALTSVNASANTGVSGNLSDSAQVSDSTSMNENTNLSGLL